MNDSPPTSLRRRPSERDRTRDELTASRQAKGRYLERHNVRVIEQKNVVVVEFVHQKP